MVQELKNREIESQIKYRMLEKMATSARETQLLKKQSNLEQATKLSILNEMTAMIAHEINQPIAAIANYARASQWRLRSEQDNESIKDEVISLLDNIVEQGERASAIIHNIRALVCGESIQLQRTSIQEICDNSIALVEEELLINQVKWTINHQYPHTILHITPIQIEQVFVNIIINAIHAMLGAQVQEKRMSIESTICENQQLHIDIINGGTSITEQETQEIFQPLYSTSEQGMGMGLSICRAIIHAHQGKIEAANVEQGFRIRIHLPYEELSPC